MKEFSNQNIVTTSMPLICLGVVSSWRCIIDGDREWCMYERANNEGVMTKNDNRETLLYDGTC